MCTTVIQQCPSKSGPCTETQVSICNSSIQISQSGAPFYNFIWMRFKALPTEDETKSDDIIDQSDAPLFVTCLVGLRA